MTTTQTFLATFFIVILACMVEVYTNIQKTTVYACSEVTKNDPIDVQLICKRARKYGD